MADENKCTNNGGTTDYYQLDPQWKQAQDIIEARNMNFAQGNILKAAFCFNTPRHRGTDYERELRKIIWFAERELESLERCRKAIEEVFKDAEIDGRIKIPDICKPDTGEVCKAGDFFSENTDDLDGLKGVVIQDYGVSKIGNSDFKIFREKSKK